MNAIPKPVRPRVLVVMGEVYANGGIQRFNRTFLTACARLGISCDVRSWKAPSCLNIRVFSHRKSRFALAVLSAALFGGHDFVVVGHINLLTLVASALALGRRRRTRSLLIAHGIEVWTHIQGRRRRALREIDTILSVSRYTADMIRLQAPELAEETFRIFPNALSESWVQGLPQSPVKGDRGRLPERFVLSVTRLDRSDRYKGIVTVIEALAMLESRSVHYIVAGNGDDLEFLEGVARRLQVADRIHFIGGVSDADLARLYQTCSIFVLPSGKEGFGIVFLEAMYFGAPVIAAKAKGAVDVVSQEESGLLVPYGDAVALKEAIDRLLRDADLRQRVRGGGRKQVTADGAFTFNAYVRRLARIFEVPGPALDSAPASSGARDSELATGTDPL